MIKSSRHPLIDYLFIMVGTLLLALGINLFYEPFQLVTGGVTGLAIVLKSMTVNLLPGGIPLWVTNTVINIPLFFIAVLVKGKEFGGRSLFGTVFLSVALFVTAPLSQLFSNSDLLLASVFGGVVSGAGLGLVFLAFSTTGGTDLAASIIQHFIRHISVARIMLALDGLIILSGLFIFGSDKALYAIISVFISAKVIDAILEGIHFSKAAFIITAQPDAISKKVFDILDRGVTGIYSQGMYTQVDKKMLLCVVSKTEIIRLKEIVRELDPLAFVIVADVREVLGEGFIEYR